MAALRNDVRFFAELTGLPELHRRLIKRARAACRSSAHNTARALDISKRSAQCARKWSAKDGGSGCTGMPYSCRVCPLRPVDDWSHGG